MHFIDDILVWSLEQMGAVAARRASRLLGPLRTPCTARLRDNTEGVGARARAICGRLESR
jgi:hypothetical protein